MTNNLAIYTTAIRLATSINDSSAGFVVEDGNYLSARWPGDVHTLSLKFVELLSK